jgi:hypothetical protein
MPTYALGRPLPSPQPCAHGGGGDPESTGKTDRPEPVFLRRCRGRDWGEAEVRHAHDGGAAEVGIKLLRGRRSGHAPLQGQQK